MLKDTIKGASDNFFKLKTFIKDREKCLLILNKVSKMLDMALSNVNKISFDNDMEYANSIINEGLLPNLDKNFLSKEYDEIYSSIIDIEFDINTNGILYKEISGKDSINENNRAVREIYDIYSKVEIEIRKFLTYPCLKIMEIHKDKGKNSKESLLYLKLIGLCDTLDNNNIKSNPLYSKKSTKSDNDNFLMLLGKNLELILDFIINEVMSIVNEEPKKDSNGQYISSLDIYSKNFIDFVYLSREITFNIDKTKLLIFNYKRLLENKLKQKEYITNSINKNKIIIGNLIQSINKKNKWYKCIPFCISILLLIIGLTPIIMKYWHFYKILFKLC